MGFLDLLKEHTLGRAMERQREQADQRKVMDYLTVAQSDPSLALPQGLNNPDTFMKLQQFMRQEVDRRGQDEAFKELAPFLQPSQASLTAGQIPTQTEFAEDAAAWAADKGINPRHSLPVLKSLQEAGNFRAEPTIQKFGDTPYIVEGTNIKVAPGFEKKPDKFDAFVDKIDMGDKIRAWKPDGTFVDFPKTASPSTVINQDTRRATDEMGMRKEFQSLPEVKAHIEISSQVERLNKAMAENAKGGSKLAVDQALITILNKMLDPSSVVRESEYARTPGDMAFLNQMRGKIEKLNTGGAGLTDEDRNAIATMSRNFADVSQSMYDSQSQYYSDLASRYGYNPENIVRLGGSKKSVGGGSKEVAPAGTRAKLKNGKIVVSDGKGGWN